MIFIFYFRFLFYPLSLKFIDLFFMAYRTFTPVPKNRYSNYFYLYALEIFCYRHFQNEKNFAFNILKDPPTLIFVSSYYNFFLLNKIF